MEEPLGTPSSTFISDLPATSTSTSTSTSTTSSRRGGPSHRLLNPSYGGRNITRHDYNLNDPARWRVPTILALTIAVVLGSALAIFLAFVAWRRLRRLRDMRTRGVEIRETRHYWAESHLYLLFWITMMQMLWSNGVFIDELYSYYTSGHGRPNMSNLYFWGQL